MVSIVAWLCLPWSWRHRLCIAFGRKKIWCGLVLRSEIQRYTYNEEEGYSSIHKIHEREGCLDCP